MQAEPDTDQGAHGRPRLRPILILVAAWAWAAAAGGGGLLLLIEKGPLPLTNGWFAMFSGIAACPLTADAMKWTLGVTPPGWARFSTALAFFAAGRVALLVGI